MIHSSLLSIRLNPGNPDHHLWNNNGTWWVHYTIHPTTFTKERVRLSLATRDIGQARRRRDALFRNQHRFALGIEGIRENSQDSLPLGQRMSHPMCQNVNMKYLPSFPVFS